MTLKERLESACAFDEDECAHLVSSHSTERYEDDFWTGACWHEARLTPLLTALIDVAEAAALQQSCYDRIEKGGLGEVRFTDVMTDSKKASRDMRDALARLEKLCGEGE